MPVLPPSPVSSAVVNDTRSTSSNGVTYGARVAGTVQSVERAVGVLRLLEAAPDSVALGDLAGTLGLAKPTVHGLVRTLVGLGLVHQDRVTGRYRPAAGVRLGGPVAPDPHVLRSLAMNWTDRLAARTGLEVQLGTLSPGDPPTVELAHHVFSPDGTTQRLRTGERHPLHATALGLVLLAHVPGAPTPRALPLTAWTSATATDAAALGAHLDVVRRQGHAAEAGTHRPGEGALAVPVRGRGGTTVAAVAVAGRQERVLDSHGRAGAGLIDHLRDTTRAITAALELG